MENMLVWMWTHHVLASRWTLNLLVSIWTIGMNENYWSFYNIQVLPCPVKTVGNRDDKLWLQWSYSNLENHMEVRWGKVNFTYVEWKLSYWRTEKEKLSILFKIYIGWERGKEKGTVTENYNGCVKKTN